MSYVPNTKGQQVQVPSAAENGSKCGKEPRGRRNHSDGSRIKRDDEKIPRSTADGRGFNVSFFGWVEK